MITIYDDVTGDPISVYLKTIQRELARGDATEHTHRPALKLLIESFGPGVTATNEPKRVQCGAPDFIVSRRKIPLGNVETKDVGANLDEMERGKGPHGEQFIRYRDGLANWVLTDYLDFHWFVAAERRLTARLARLNGKGKVRPEPQGEEQLAQLMDAFLRQEAPTVGTARELAQRMAGMARILRDLIIRAFEHEPEGGWLHNWLSAFRETLIPDLDEKQFADMFAQTLAYGLFAAKVHSGSGKDFSRQMAAYELPKTNPFLRKLFSEIAGVDMPETINWAVDDIVELLKHADMAEILKDFGKGEGKEDPVVHFYETFLAAYDPKMRELRGVYYTPEPVVSYIVRSVDHLLKTRFNRPKGLADENTLILDPATGTATFLYFVIRQIYEELAGQRGAWDSYVSAHLLNRVFGFELLMAPYAVAHLKLGMELQETGYSFGSDQRLGIYLTNTLEEAAKKSEKLFAQWISDEANAAAHIKRDLPIMVVLGNPPYSGVSANRGEWITKLIESYREVDGQPLGEKKVWLKNDYVKFIRFGQWRIERTGEGILAFITDHSYLDSPTFRGMRANLLRSFNEIYVLNLHGNSKRREKSPDGSPDENVFDITQGVAIALFIRWHGNESHEARYADLWGTREAKYAALEESDVSDTQWTKIAPADPLFQLVTVEEKTQSEYTPSWTITDVFQVGSNGVQTSRDSLVVGFDAPTLEIRIASFADKSREAPEVRREFFGEKSVANYPPGDTREWKLNEARGKLQETPGWRDAVAAYLYRPLDERFLLYADYMVDWPRQEVMGQLKQENLAICVGRAGLVASGPWDLLFCAQRICDHNLFYRGSSLNFPLYLYPTAKTGAAQRGLGVEVAHWPAGKDGRGPNLNPEFIADMEKRLGLKFVPEVKGDVAAGLPRHGVRDGDVKSPLRGATTFGPEDIFNYIYGVFHSPTYRSRYAEFLKSDFPRVPLTSDVSLFRNLCELGGELVALHLLESPLLEKPITSYPVKGSNVVEKGFPKYVAPGEPELGTGKPVKEGRVYINLSALTRPDKPGHPLPEGEGRKALISLPSPRTRGEGRGEGEGQYFDGVPPEVWNFHIGGYQVCEKWLKDRRGRTLSYDDLEHYRKVVTALQETIRVMAEIDAAIPKWPIE